MLSGFRWNRDPRNPVLRPGSEDDCSRCMNPFALRVGDQLRLYYSGGDARGCQRLCLATSPVGRPTEFTRQGAILGLGADGAFDAHWCVLPCVHRFGDRWHLYYSGHEGSDLGLQSFPGIGLAVSEDGLHFERHSTQPLITGDRTPQFPSNRGIAGGGTILQDRLPDGTTRYRMYYTLAVGTRSDDVRIDQEKHCAVCHSADGIEWTDHRLIMSSRQDAATDDIAVAAPFVWRDDGVYRMLYSGIGTRWGYYSISEAVSEDGYAWDRGQGDENLSLAPDPSCPWESEMVEYPCLIRGQGRLRLFYCGNGYGSTGIGTAVGCLTAEDAEDAEIAEV